MNEPLVFFLLPALAMSLGWGIRGQFGGETGAMIPGVMVGLALGIVSGLDFESCMRLGAVGLISSSVGGSMTYGQTLGLVHNEWPSRTLWKGVSGCAIKGGVWIGLTGACLGMAASDVFYRPRELFVLFAGAVGLFVAGLQWINRPHIPPSALPKIYFSARDAEKPRVECWGGLWAALTGLLVYAGCVRGDWRTVALALFGVAGGGIGFAFGELLQAWGIHYKPFGKSGPLWMDWWKLMEMVFGLLAGLGLAAGWAVAGFANAPHVNFVEYSALFPPVTEALLGAILAALVVAGMMGVKYVETLWDTPMIFVTFALPLALFGTWTPGVIVVVLALSVSFANMRYHRLRGERLVVAREWVVWGATLVACFALVVQLRAAANIIAVFVFVVWSQILLTMLKCLRLDPAGREKGATVSFRAWFRELRAQLVVEAGFVVIGVWVTWLVC